MHLKTQRVNLLILLGLLLSLTISIHAQDNTADSIDCAPESLAFRQETLQEIMALDFVNNPDIALANMFRLGAAYQDLAIACGYNPTATELDAVAQRTLALMNIEDLLLTQSVGTDVEAIIAELDTVTGDSFTGQLLYSGQALALDGSALGCIGCHNGETAPVVEGTWTRVDEVRLNDPALEGYTIRYYLVESIVNPNAYIIEGHVSDLMPNYFGTRLDIQQLADIIAYLESQDQLLDE